MGTPLFPGLGRHCGVESCRQLDFLPYRCNGCHQFFCGEHRTHAGHGCPAVGAHDRVVLICHVCATSVPRVYSEDASLTLRRHSESGKCHSANARKPRCPVRGCKDILTFQNSLRCKACNQTTCMRHRYPSDHGCSSLNSMAAQKNNNIRVVQWSSKSKQSSRSKGKESLTTLRGA